MTLKIAVVAVMSAPQMRSVALVNVPTSKRVINIVVPVENHVSPMNNVHKALVLQQVVLLPNLLNVKTFVQTYILTIKIAVVAVMSAKQELNV